LQVVSEGLTYKEIAKKLHISMETVKQHMKNIFQKLQVNKRGQAVSRARALSLLED
jgi:LuxR family maltose regulon positive regulatory protein